MILLYHETANAGSIATPARLGREHHAPRHYQHEGHFIVLNGPIHVITYDAEEICKVPGYRLATPYEQEQYASMQKQSGTLQETISGQESATRKGVGHASTTNR